MSINPDLCSNPDLVRKVLNFCKENEINITDSVIDAENDSIKIFFEELTIYSYIPRRGEIRIHKTVEFIYYDNCCPLNEKFKNY